MDEERQLATDSLQALERLYLCCRNSPDNDLKVKVYDALDQLRAVRGKVEGGGEDFAALTVDDSPLIELKQLLLMHTPSTITEDAKQQFSSLITQALKGRCRKVLAAMVMTCPWYAASQRERGEKAKHNTLVVVVMAEDRHFLSPVSLHAKRTGSVVDKGWLMVVEMHHFGHLLVTGRSRWVEAALCGQQALVVTSPEWTQLRTSLVPQHVTGLRGFLEACVNQGLGAVVKKKKRGGLKLAPSATVDTISTAFRLLHHAHSHHSGVPLTVSDDLSPAALPDVAKQALDRLTAMYTDPDMDGQGMLDCLLTWHKELKASNKACTFTDQRKVTEVVGHWMAETRLQGRKLPSVTAGPEDSNSRLLQLMEEIGGPVGQLAPHQVLLVARAGSFMYGLSTPDSDVDYVIIYRHTTESVLSACIGLTESCESRGPKKMVEYGAYEARLLCEMLTKCSVVILELVYLGEHEFVSPHWQRLHDQRERFVTERGIQQYLGLIKNNFGSLNRPHRTPYVKKERKLLYQIFHKMDSVRHMLHGVAPPVRVTGPVRDFIMDVRTKPQEGDLSRESILDRATAEFEALRQQLANRKTRLPETPDARYITDWLLSVRGDVFC